MHYNSLDIIEEIKKLVDLYDLTFREVTVGECPVVPIKLWIEQPRVEVTTTARSLIIRDGEGRSKSFDKSLIGCNQKSLQYIEELLTSYKNLGRQKNNRPSI